MCKINCPTGEDKLSSRCRDEFLTSCIRCRIKSARSQDKSNQQQSSVSTQSHSQCTALCDWGKRQSQAKKEIRAEVSNVRFTEKNSRASLSGNIMINDNENLSQMLQVTRQ